MDSDRTKRMLDGIKNAGRSEVVTVAGVLPGNTPNVVTLINLNASDDESVPITVYLSATPENNDSGQLFLPYLVAELEWGTDGFQHQAQVDWVRGMALSLLCSYLRVKTTFDVQAFNPINPMQPLPVRAGATAAYGTRPGYLPPTRTFFAHNVAAGATSGNILIPPFAKDVTLAWEDSGPPLPAYELQIRNGTPAVTTSRLATSGFGSGTQHVPLPSDARTVRVLNPSATSQTFAFIFGLAF